MYKMVVVDDEPLMLEGFSKAIDWEQYGYHLAGAFRSPSGLLEFCRKERPDILLLDINMPEVDGITLLKQVKELFPEMYVIMLTAHNEFSFVRDSLRYHADEYLWKPEISFQDILECMNRLIQSDKAGEGKRQESDKRIYEFSDYEEEKNRFSLGIFNELLADVERFLELEDIRDLENAVKQIWEMILRDKPSKVDILSGVLHLAYLYREKLREGEDPYLGEEAEGSLEESSIFCWFYEKNTYQEFAQGMQEIFQKQNQKVREEIERDTHELEKRMKTYLEQNLNNMDLNLMQLSRAVGLSYSYCSRIFPELMGKNFSRYLIELRMEKACEYLKYSGYKIDKILELVGYSDKSYFVKSFKQYTNMTPFRYREKYKPGVNGDGEKKI